MKKVTALTAFVLSIVMPVGVASADVDTAGQMTGGLTGNHNNGLSWQVLQDIDIDGTPHNVFRLYADRNWMNSICGSGCNNEIIEVQGSLESPSSAITNGVIYKNALAPANGPSTEGWNGVFPNLKYTSYTTIGASTESTDCVWLGDQGWTPDGFTLSDATFGALPNFVIGFTDSDEVAMGAGNTLLIQITTTGTELMYELEIGTRNDFEGTDYSVQGIIDVSGSSCPGDFDDSGGVSGADLTALLGAWGNCGDCPADLDENGLVDGADLAALLATWGSCN